jgi:hypothetical protein
MLITSGSFTYELASVTDLMSGEFEARPNRMIPLSLSIPLNKLYFNRNIYSITNLFFVATFCLGLSFSLT